MSSFYPTATVVDVNDQQKSVSVADCLKTATADGLTWCLCMYESIVTTADKKNPGVPTTKYLTLGTLCIASTAVFAALERASTLLPWGKATFVNFGAWVYPAMATIAEAGLGAQPEDNGGRNPCAYAGYWVLFALLSTFDGVLAAVIPFYFFAKACLLAWGASSARPYGGRHAFARIFKFINNTNSPLPTKTLISAEVAATSRTGISPRAFRLGLAIATVGLATFSLGICTWAIVTAESYFSCRPSWLQARVCVVAGAAWPLHATLVARARGDRATLAATAAKQETKGGNSDNTDHAAASAAPVATKQRQGPAAVQWLSYWPMYASLLVLDSVLGWVPHWYSAKLVLLALLALPQTRGAYLVTSLVLYSSDLGSSNTNNDCQNDDE